MKYCVKKAGKGRYQYWRVYSVSNEEAKRLKRDENARIFGSKSEAKEKAREMNN